MQTVSGKLNADFYSILEKLEEPFFEVRDLDISSRMVNYYDKEGLLYYSKQELNRKRKFSAIQLCWIKIVAELLSFGYDKEKIFILKRGLENFEYADKGRSYDTLTFHLTLIASYEMDFRLVLNKEEAFGWTLFSNTHQVEFTSKNLFAKEATLTVPLLPKISNEIKQLTGKKIEPSAFIYSSIEVEEKELLDIIKNKPIFKIELSFPENFANTSGKGKLLQKIDETDTKKLGEFLRHMKHGEVRLTYGSEPGVPLYGSVAKTIKFKSRKDAVTQIIRRTK